MRRGVARASGALLLAVLAGAGCSEEAGPSTDPAKRLFSAPYGGFIAAAGPHRATCELALKAKGDGGKRNDGMKTTVEVDDIGSFRIVRGDGFEIVHVGSIAWQRSDAKSPLKRMESGARPELLRDAAAAPWRPLLAPFGERVKLERTGSKELGDRTLDVFTIALEAGGGADGGPKADAGTGTVELDAATGFPVAFAFEGGWEEPATHVSYTVDTMTCAITLGDVAMIEPPEKVGPPPMKTTEAPPPPAPSPSPTAAAPPKSKPLPKKK